MATDNSFPRLRDEISSALVDTTRTTGQISHEDLAFHRSSNPSIIPTLENQSSRLLQLARRLTRSISLGTEVSVPQLSSVDSVEDNWKSIVDVFDDLLERADACLDEYTGAVRRLAPSQDGQTNRVAPPAGKQKPGRTYRTQDIAKPQLLFENVPGNDELTPFKPLIRSKPHAITPYEESFVLVSSDGSEQYKHPYETEITKFHYPAHVYLKADPIPYMPYDNTRAILVDTPEALMSMLKELRFANEIAVDLEHHDEHSFIGLVSLLQISTREKDWIVDTLKPWRQDLQILNDVFADPNILKVFHGAYMDMIWLQRDLGLYVVGLFDTYHASRALGYPRNSLAYLLKHFASFDAAKQYQMADWRIRPLPEEMFDYARSDTHFLLYIYDNLRNELIDQSNYSHADGDLIKAVMVNSKEESLQRYKRPLYDAKGGMGAMGWYGLLCRTPALFNREQFAVFRAVHQWRDTVAREEDESVHVVMPKKVLYNIAREVPTTMPSLLGCSHPVSKFFQKRKKDLVRLINQVKTDSAMEPEMKEYMGTIQTSVVQHKVSSTQDKEVRLPPTTAVHEPLLSTLPTMTVLAARSDTSIFWGPLVSNGLPSNDHTVQLCNGSFRLSLPFPQLTAEIIKNQKAEANADMVSSQTGSVIHPEHRYVRGRTSNQDVFLVKEAGASRKRKASEMQEPPEPLSSTQNGLSAWGKEDEANKRGMTTGLDSGDPQAEPVEKGRSRRAKKEAQKLEHSVPIASATTAPGVSNVQPFDYANAPSMLHAKRSGIEAQGTGGKKAEDPYAKSLNAPKELRKTRNEGGGNRSLTFKH